MTALGQIEPGERQTHLLHDLVADRIRMAEAFPLNDFEAQQISSGMVEAAKRNMHAYSAHFVISARRSFSDCYAFPDSVARMQHNLVPDRQSGRHFRHAAVPVA